MKAYTDLEQSKKLAEILPIETADMCWCNNSVKGINYTDEYAIHTHTVEELRSVFDEALNGWDKYWKLIPAWSLAALLSIIPLPSLDNIIDEDMMSKWSCVAWHDKGHTECICSNPIDACVEVIVKLKEKNLL